MQYREFKGLNKKVSALGFGAMRLPHQNGDTSKIEENEATEMIRYAIDRGVNYIDTAWPYHQRESEPFIAKALGEGYREKVFLATKMPSWLIEKKEDMDEYLKAQLKRLKTEQIDIYLLHTLDSNKWRNLKKLDVLSWLEKMKKEGFIGNFGFSFHDSFPVFKDIMDSYPWPLCQIQYNYVDKEFQAGKKGLIYANKKGAAVIIMEPLRGGSLATLPPKLLKILQSKDKKRTPADWALQWLWDQEEVTLVLSGMSTLEQVKENIESANRAYPNSLSPLEREKIEGLTQIYRELSPTGCTGCNYCVPCPEGIMIPSMMALYNESHIYENYEKKKGKYLSYPEKGKSKNCTYCESCLKKCPQNIPIPDFMEKITHYFEKG